METFDPISASRAVLIEVANVLGAFREHFVVVGGWVPELLYPNLGHMGSIDVDLAIAPTALAGNAYETIRKRMVDAGYIHQTGPTRFLKVVAGVVDPVKVDVISGQYVQGEKSAAILVNELALSSLRGIDLAFEACEEIELSGHMPDGYPECRPRTDCAPEVFILIKAFALDERTKQKDAFDIIFILLHFKPDLAALAARVRPHVAKGLGNEAYNILNAKFATIDSVGPEWAARVIEEQGIRFDKEPGTGTGALDYEQARRTAFEYAQDLFRAIGQ